MNKTHKKIFILLHIYFALCIAFTVFVYGKIAVFKDDMRDEHNRVLTQVSRTCGGELLEFEEVNGGLKAKCR